MAQINTTFGFKDQITQNLSLLNNVLTQMNRTLGEMKGQMGNANQAINNVAQSSERAANSVGGISSKLVNFNMATQVFRTVKGAVDSVTESIGEMSAAYNYQMTQENKLETVMKTRMKASKEQIQSIKDYASDLQKGGVIGDEVQLAGAQELATYISDVDTLKTLMPVLNDIAVQASPDMNVNGQQMSNLATMLGKVMGGNLSGMSRRGWVFTDEEKKQFEKMSEEQRAKFLAAYAQDAIGKQNQNAAQTAAGQIIQLNNAIGDMKESIGQALVPFTKFFTLATAQWKLKWYGTIVKALNFLKKHINDVIIVLGALGVAVYAVGAYFVYLQRTAVKAAIATAVKWAAANLQIVLAGGAILAAIVLLGALLVCSETVFPAIGGLIGGLAGIVKEESAWMKFYMGQALEFLGNGFLKLPKPIISAFQKVFDFLLRGWQFTAKAIDSVAGTNFVAQIQGLRTGLEKFANTKSGEFKLGWTDDRVGFDNAWRSGKTSGELAGTRASNWLNAKIDKFTSRFKEDKALSPDAIQESMAAGIESGFHFDGSGNLLTKDNGKQDIADDFAELIRNRATAKYDIRMSQVTPQITISGVQISGDMSYEMFVERLKNDMEEVANASL